MTTYRLIADQVLDEMGDFSWQSVDVEFIRSLSELCVNLIQLIHEPQATQQSVTFPSPVSAISILANAFVPLVEMNKLQRSDGTVLADLMLLLVVRDANGLEFQKSSLQVIEYFPDALTLPNVRNIPNEYYTVFTNILGIRSGSNMDLPISVTYVNYLQLITIDDLFPLDDSYIQIMQQFLRFFLYSRISRFELAKRELERAMKDVHR